MAAMTMMTEPSQASCNGGVAAVSRAASGRTPSTIKRRSTTPRRGLSMRSATDAQLESRKLAGMLSATRCRQRAQDSRCASADDAAAAPSSRGARA